MAKKTGEFMVEYCSFEEWSPYTLRDFRSFYGKICAQLKPSESELVYKLSKSSERAAISHSNLIGLLGAYGHASLSRPFDEKAVEQAKKNYLHGLLCGSSIDYLEFVSDEFWLLLADKRLIGDDNCMLFIAGHKKDGSGRTLGEIIAIGSSMCTDAMHSGSFVSHLVDTNDYAIVGKKLPEEEYRKRLHEWELDVNWD